MFALLTQQAPTGAWLQLFWQVRETDIWLGNISAAFNVATDSQDSSMCWLGVQEAGPTCTRSVFCVTLSLEYTLKSFLLVKQA